MGISLWMDCSGQPIQTKMVSVPSHYGCYASCDLCYWHWWQTIPIKVFSCFSNPVTAVCWLCEPGPRFVISDVFPVRGLLHRKKKEPLKGFCQNRHKSLFWPKCDVWRIKPIFARIVVPCYFTGNSTRNTQLHVPHPVFLARVQTYSLLHSLSQPRNINEYQWASHQYSQRSRVRIPLKP